MSFPRTSPFRDWRAALLIAVGAACATPDPAIAGCGNHVVTLYSNDLIAPEAAATVAPFDAAGFPMLPTVPCSGSDCSRAPARQHAPCAPTSSGPHGKEGAPALAADEPADRSSARLHDLVPPRPSRPATSIFHPPRGLSRYLP